MQRDVGGIGEIVERVQQCPVKIKNDGVIVSFIHGGSSASRCPQGNARAKRAACDGKHDKGRRVFQAPICCGSITAGCIMAGFC